MQNSPEGTFLFRRIVLSSLVLLVLLAVSMFLGLSIGPTGQDMGKVWGTIMGTGEDEAITGTIIWRIRFPRVLLAALVGSTLSLGGLVFQALLRNPLAEPYILGISGGSAVGAILGIMLGLSRFPGVAILAFLGSMATLVLVLFIASGQKMIKENALLLGGVMVNAFCSAIIMFLVSLTEDSRLHSVLFWLMGDLSMSDSSQVLILLAILIPCFAVIMILGRTMNLLLLGEETALNLGVNVRAVSVGLLILTSLMVSMTVCQSGLVGFVGLVMPHLLRLLLGPDHRVLIPACILGGACFMVSCDLLARTLPAQGELPVGVITALIGAPLFILLLHRSRS
jgi:iron complex transport system permease protein